jgi:hypothetical protein
MSVKLLKSINAGQDIYYDALFRQVIEDHLSFLNKDENHNTANIEPADGDIHNGDFFGLLNSQSAPMELHWCIMRLNGYTSPTEYTSDTLTIKVPNPAVLSRLVKQFRTNQSIRKKSKK